MLSVPELEKLMTDLESDRVERKASTSDREGIRRAVCAFANDLPGHAAAGYVFVGVSDGGHPTSLAINDRVLSTLANFRFEGNILPVPSLAVQRLSLIGVPVAVVEVQPSDAPPVRYKGQVWVRVGPTCRIATPDEERRLAERQIAGVRTFDQRPCTGATLDDLLLETFRADFLPRVVEPAGLAENNRAVEEQLASLRFYDVKRRIPTNGGVLVFGRDPLQHLPGAYIQFVRFDGGSLADAVQDDKVLTGNLLTQLLQLDHLLPLQIRTARTGGTGLHHQPRPDYPLDAIREIALNAVMHRTYEGTNASVRIYWFSDRLEVQNPGGLYGQVTPQNFERVSDYRNPLIAGALKALGYVERFGTGITRAEAALRGNGNPPAEFTFEQTHVLVTIRRAA